MIITIRTFLGKKYQRIKLKEDNTTYKDLINLIKPPPHEDEFCSGIKIDYSFQPILFNSNYELINVDEVVKDEELIVTIKIEKKLTIKDNIQLDSLSEGLTKLYIKGDYNHPLPDLSKELKK